MGKNTLVLYNNCTGVAGEGRKQRREKSGGLPNTFDGDCGYYINVLH